MKNRVVEWSNSPSSQSLAEDEKQKGERTIVVHGCSDRSIVAFCTLSCPTCSIHPDPKRSIDGIERMVDFPFSFHLEDNFTKAFPGTSRGTLMQSPYNIAVLSLRTVHRSCTMCHICLCEVVRCQKRVRFAHLLRLGCFEFKILLLNIQIVHTLADHVSWMGGISLHFVYFQMNLLSGFFSFSCFVW